MRRRIDTSPFYEKMLSTRQMRMNWNTLLAYIDDAVEITEVDEGGNEIE